MNINFTVRQKELMDKFLIVTQWSKKRRIVRLLTSPWKIVYPKLIKITKINKEVKTRTFWGGEINVILPEPVSLNIYYDGYFEKDVVMYMLSFLKEGMTFIDIGTHFGFFTLFGSYLVGSSGKVLAFEPTPSTYKQLQKNIGYYCNNPNVEIYNCAAFSEETEMRFYDYGLENSAYNSMLESRTINNSFITRNELLVKAIKIDNILREKDLKKIDMIKIDAESTEIHVLKGMIETLKNYKPNIILEVGDFEIHGAPKSNEIISWLKQMNYSPYEVLNAEIVRHVIREKYEYGNLLFMADK